MGEWVLAVGNPFNLTSTVTAGIVSAKGRDINILQGDASWELDCAHGLGHAASIALSAQLP